MDSQQSLRFLQEDFDLLAKISRRALNDIPLRKEIWNKSIEANLGFNPHFSIPKTDFHDQIKSIFIISDQMLYSIERLKGFSDKESSNITEFYVSYYFSDFVSRVKTGTDLIALIINFLYDLNLDDKQCSLESGKFVAALRVNSVKNEQREKLARLIDKHRTKWLATFFKLRNIAIHKSGFKYMGSGEINGYPTHIMLSIPETMFNKPIHFNPENPLDTIKEHFTDDELAKFLVKINSNSASQHLVSVNPVILCNEIWALWAQTVNDIINHCKSELLSKL